MLARLTSSVTAKLLLTFLVVMATLFGVGGYFGAETLVDRVYEPEEHTSLDRRATSRAEALQSLIASLQKRVDLVAEDTTLRRVMTNLSRTDIEHFQNADDANDSHASIVDMLGRLVTEDEQRNRHVAAISLIKVNERPGADENAPKHGDVVYRHAYGGEPDTRGENKSKEIWFTEALEGRRVSSFVSVPGKGRFVFFMSPIHELAHDTGAAKRLVGLLVIKFRNQRLVDDSLVRGLPPRKGQRSSTFLIDENGVIQHEFWVRGPTATGCPDSDAACWLAHPTALGTNLGAKCLASWVKTHRDELDDLVTSARAKGAPVLPTTEPAECENPATGGWWWNGRPAMVGIDFVNPAEVDRVVKDAQPTDESKLETARFKAAHAHFPIWFVISVEDAADWRASERNKTLSSIYVAAAIALIVTSLIVFFITRSKVRELQELLDGTAALATGKLETRVNVRSRDEVGKLTAGFNHMAERLESAIETVTKEHKAAATARVVAEKAQVVAEEATARANEANEAKSTFLANMSHELRTPLNAIIGYSEMLAEDSTDDAVIANLEKIRGAGKHLLGLIGDLLDISKIEAGKMTLFNEAVDLKSLIGDVVSTIRPLISKNENELVVDMPAELGSMRTDVMKLRQSLFNLLSNATKFTSKGKVGLTIKKLAAEGKEPERVVFAVSDTGIGITPEQMSRLFRAFSQADDSTTRKYGGTGLGLVLTKKFIELMGGSIEVTSVAGTGTTFTITLPVEPVVAPAVESTKELGPTDKQGRNILVIDDDPASRELVQRALVKAGFGVRVAVGGVDGLAQARANLPDAIVLDVAMPDVDGWSVLSELKDDPKLRDIPVVMLTIHDDRERGIALGAADYVNKPVDWEHFARILDKRVGRGGHVLVVDDDEGSREMARRTLSKLGYAVEEAENGRIALEKIAKAAPALILLDLMMPELSGFDVIRSLQKDPKHRSIPVIVMTAKQLTAEDRARLTAGVQHVYQKGAYDREELIAQIQGLVRVAPTSVASAAKK